MSAQDRSQLPIEVVRAAEQYPGRFIPAIDSKATTEAISLRRVESEINSGRFQAVGEVLIYHEAKPYAHAERFTYTFDTPFIARTLDYAFANHWPAIVHIEFASMSDTERPAYQKMLEDALAAHPDNAFLLNNLGTLTPELAATLLAAHPNLYLLTSTTTPYAINDHPHWTNMFRNRSLNAAWTQVVERYPDRFLCAFDNVTAGRWQHTYLQDVDLWRDALGALPPDVARALAHGNAERLWHLTPASS
jgi:predicted TIM-barrel fold metal-dependent hydrolase